MATKIDTATALRGKTAHFTGNDDTAIILGVRADDPTILIVRWADGSISQPWLDDIAFVD